MTSLEEAKSFRDGVRTSRNAGADLTRLARTPGIVAHRADSGFNVLFELGQMVDPLALMTVGRSSLVLSFLFRKNADGGADLGDFRTHCGAKDRVDAAFCKA
jgi:hypothetical protein